MTRFRVRAMVGVVVHRQGSAMGLRSLTVAGGRVAMAGLAAAFVSQASGPDGHAIAWATVGLASVAALAAVGFASAVRGPARWLPVLPATLGIVAAAEAAVRVWG